MLRWLLVLLCALSALAQESFYGTVVKRTGNEFTARSAQGATEGFSAKAPAPLPAWVKPGVKLQVDFERLKVAVAIPGGGRGCLDVNQIVQLKPWDGKTPPK